MNKRLPGNVDCQHGIFVPPLETNWDDALEDGTAYPGTIEVSLVELTWLARDLQWYGMGIGATLMIDVVKKVAVAADCIGLIGLHLRSTPGGVGLYKGYSFQPFKEHPTYDEFRYILPVGTIRLIAQRTNQVSLDDP